MMRGGGGSGGSAERGEATGFGSESIGALRGLVSRLPDADVVLQGGMSEGLRNWDLWYGSIGSFITSILPLANVR